MQFNKQGEHSQALTEFISKLKPYSHLSVLIPFLTAKIHAPPSLAKPHCHESNNFLNNYK